MLQPAPTDSLGFALADTARLMRAAFEATIADAGLGITPGEARALMNVAAVASARQAALAERMGIEPMTLSGYVDRLEAQGLVAREADPADRRARLVRLTDDGERLAQAIRPLARRLWDEVTAPLGAEGGERLRQMLVTLRDALQERRNG